MSVRSRASRRFVLVTACLLASVALAPSASGEQAASQLRSFQAGMLDAGDAHTCAILDDGSAACWGFDVYGQLGDEALTTGSPVPSPVKLPAGKKAVAITAGGGHTCALLDDGSASCWGRDDVGQLGDDALTTGSPAPSPVKLPAGKKAVAITAGSLHTCAILDDGSAYCWGWDFHGQLGDGALTTGSPVPSPVKLPAGKKAVAITAGGHHTCAILNDGSASCWGRDFHGQLGDDALTTGSPVPSPVKLPPGKKAVAITAGFFYTCAILDDGSVSCWGADDAGQLGDDALTTGTPAPSPVKLPAGKKAVTITAGAAHTCAILDDGSAPCWGSDDFGQLGDGGANTNTNAPSTYAFSVGSMAARVADISLRIEAAPTSLALGTTTQITLRIENQGPDPAAGVKVVLSPSLLQIASANAGQGSVTGSTWDVGTLSVGQQSALFVTLSAPTAGGGALRAEVSASDVVDSDSKPNNGIATEDDQAEVAITVPAPAVTPPSPATPTALTLTKFSLSKKTFRAEGLKGTRTVGTQIRFSLSTDATVTVTIERRVAKKFKKAGSFSFKAKAGQVRRTFTGVLGKKPLAKGSYRMRIRAVAGTTTRTAGPIIFTIAAAQALHNRGRGDVTSRP